MTALLRPFLFAKALYLDRKQRKRIEQLEEETLEKVDRLLDENVPINLELGHAHIDADDWLTLDQHLDCDFFWDYRNNLPFPAASIDVLYSHNNLRSLSGLQLEFLLSECYRTLKPGGAFFFSVPDAEPVIKAYAEKQHHIFPADGSVWKPGWHDTGSYMDQVSYLAYCNGHAQFMFDRQNVVHLCQKAGFAPTELRSPDPRIDAAPTEPDMLFVVARKPL